MVVADVESAHSSFSGDDWELMHVRKGKISAD
jgi:hypothetical protein